MRCAAGRPNPQLMSALLSEESRLYSLVFSNVECVPVKGFQEKRHRHGQSCFTSFPCIPHRSLISLFFSGGIFSLLVSLWAPALCLISGSRLTSTSERKYDRSFEGLILSSLSLSAPHLVSFTSFFFFFTIYMVKLRANHRCLTAHLHRGGWVSLVHIRGLICTRISFHGLPHVCVSIGDLCFSLPGHYMAAEKQQRVKQV